MSYLYGKKFVGPITPTILALREELYNVTYHEIDWNKARDTCAKVRFSKTLVQNITLILEEKYFIGRKFCYRKVQAT
jgi:achilleol B synthase